MARITKPADIAKNEFMSAKWDEITKGRNFKSNDIPSLKMLCHWYAVAEQCMSDLKDEDGGIEVAFINQYGDWKQRPQISSMKTASAEIRLINQQLGINDEVAPVAKKVEAFKTLRGKASNASKAKARKTAS